MTLDVLNLEWTSCSSRDRDPATLVCNSLRHQNYTVFEGSVFNGYALIKKLKPKLIFMTNTTGSSLNQALSRYGKSKGIKIVTTYSEGYLREEAMDEMVWGHNHDKIPFEDSIGVWSHRSLEMIKKEYPILGNITNVSGSIFIDKNIISNIKTKNDKQNQRDLTIGIGCWGFDIFMDPERSKVYTNSVISFFKDQRNKFNRELSKIIENNQDINFIIKQHPGNTFGYKGSGVESCVQYDNVEIYQNDKSINWCIQNSNLWITYDSTTALEAWMLNIETCLLNPGGSNWPINRDQMHLNQPIYNDAISIQHAINLLKIKKNNFKFEKHFPQKEKIISEISQWTDGLNHVRLGNLIISNLKSTKKSPILNKSLNLSSYFTILKQKIRWFLYSNFPSMKMFSNPNQIHRSWKQEEVIKISKKLMEKQKIFYKKSNLNKLLLKKIIVE